MKTYSIFFTGETQEHISIEQLKINLAKLFKTDLSKIEKMFIGKAVCIKKSITADEVKKYQQAMFQVGAKVVVKESVKQRVENNIDKNIPKQAITGQNASLAAANIAAANIAEPNNSAQLSAGLAGLINYNKAADVDAEKSSEKIITTEHDANSTISDGLTLSLPNSGSLEEFSNQIDDYEMPDLDAFTLKDLNEGTFEEFTDQYDDYEMPNLDAYSMSEPNEGSLEEFTKAIVPVEIEDISYLDITNQNDRPLSDQEIPAKKVVLPSTEHLKAESSSLEEFNEEVEPFDSRCIADLKLQENV